MSEEINFANKNTIVNLSNSILKHFNVPTYHDSIPEIDNLLKGHKKVVVMLFDGMGHNVIRKHLKENSYIRKHYVHMMEATFPPTTVASTTGFLSAQYPIENGWIGWRQYFKKYDTNVLVFPNKNTNTGEVMEDSAIHEVCRYTSIIELIKKHNKKVNATSIFGKKTYPTGPKNFFRAFLRINKTLKSEYAFTYFYWNQPDHTLHDEGVDSKKVTKLVKKINRFVRNITLWNKDTLFLVIADHGMKDVTMHHVFEHEDLVKTFARDPSLEGRATAFFVNDENKEIFESLFNKYYGEHFILIKSEDALEKGVFGEGQIHKNARGFFGDYIAIAKDEYAFVLDKTFDFVVKAHHAGYTKEEMEIDISAFNV